MVRTESMGRVGVTISVCPSLRNALGSMLGLVVSKDARVMP